MERGAAAFDRQAGFELSPSSDPRTGKLPLHIDVNATDRDRDAEPARLLALGARPTDVGQTGTVSWHVLADPESNEFCLLRPRRQAVVQTDLISRRLAARSCLLSDRP